MAPVKQPQVPAWPMPLPKAAAMRRARLSSMPSRGAKWRQICWLQTMQAANWRAIS